MECQGRERATLQFGLFRLHYCNYNSIASLMVVRSASKGLHFCVLDEKEVILY